MSSYIQMLSKNNKEMNSLKNEYNNLINECKILNGKYKPIKEISSDEIIKEEEQLGNQITGEVIRYLYHVKNVEIYKKNIENLKKEIKKAKKPKKPIKKPKKKSASKKSVKRKVTASEKAQVAGRQHYTCANKPNTNVVPDYNCPLWLNSNGNFDQSGYDIDHIKEFCNTHDDSLNNLQALCKSCHSVKTRRFNSKRRKAKKN